MTTLSLRLRSLLLAIVALAFFIPITVYTLEKAYTESLVQAKYNELSLMGLTLISAFELEDDSPNMPEFLYDEQLNMLDSGYLAAIVFQQKIVWQSVSALNYQINSLTPPPPVGKEEYQQDYQLSFDPTSRYFTYSYSAEFEASNGYEPVTFYIFNNTHVFEQERQTFMNTVWKYLSLLGIALIVILLVGLNRLLHPVHSLIGEIQFATKGEVLRLSKTYPVEFTELKDSINLLLKTEAEQRTRYKNSLGDLAHSLKTPLAVALGTSNLPSEAQEPLRQINELIQRQLKRATLGATSWEKPQKIESVAQSINNAMSKIHVDKSINISLSGSALFWGDKTDLLEILGNIVDNACKAAQSRVSITLNQSEHWSEIIIDDDGAGIDESKIDLLLTRGKRLDTYEEGQGIGMAVVADLVDAYQGQLHIMSSPFNGARVIVKFPTKKALLS